MCWRNFRYFLLLLFLNGCVSLEPYIIDNEQLREVTEDLRVKATELQIERTLYVNNLGYKLLKVLKETKTQYPYLGILVSSLDKYLAKIYGLGEDEERLIIYGVVKDSPAYKAGLKAGDLLISINSQEVTPYRYPRLIAQLPVDRKVMVEVERGGKRVSFAFYPERVSWRIDFLVVPEDRVNAAAFSGGVAVTSGLLNFIKNEDELAIVLGHELAHLVKGHILKKSGLEILSTIATLLLTRELETPQARDTTEILGRAFSMYFSRDFEREADYYGTIFAYKAGFDVERGIEIWERLAIELPQTLNSDFLASHPTSSERLLGLRKIVEEIKNNPEE